LISGKGILHKREIFGSLISLALAGLFLFIAFRGISFFEFIRAVGNVSLPLLLLLIVSTVFSHILRALRWKLLLRYLKPDISLHHAFASVMIGYGFNNVVPRLGEISRAIFLGQYEKISRISILGSIVVERVIDMIMFGLAVLISGLIYTSGLSHTFGWLRLSLIIGIAAVFSVIFLLVLLVRNEQQLFRIIRKLFRHSSEQTLQRILAFCSKLIAGFTCFKTFADVAWATLLSVAIMLNYALSTYIGFMMVGMLNISFPMAWVTMSISAIGVMIPTPGGIGSYHTITRSILTNLYSYSGNISVTYAFLSHAVGYLGNIIIAIVYIFAFRKRFGDIDFSSLLRNERDTE
jgi:uncharacterized protein (TIRG00374 family)